jgi:translation initiation factor 3 subunit B
LLSDLLKKKPCETDGMENVVVVDEIPKVEPARQEKLENVIKKLFSTCGEIVNVFYPKDDNGYTKGYSFIEYKNPLQAEEAVKVYSNYRLDKTHTLHVNIFTDFQKYEVTPAEWSPPEPQPYTPTVDLYSFLTEQDAYDQYCVVVDNASAPSQVQFWENSLPDPTEIHRKDKFTEQTVKWSPLGTYIVAFHKQGVAIWGGPQFTRINKFAHPGTTHVDFSPKENFIVTYGAANANGSGSKVIIWDIRTGLEKRSFVADPQSPTSIFRWSHDDKYVASMGDGAIHIYETDTFFLLDKKSIKIPGIRGFGWSPSDNIIAYWVAEQTDVPAKVTLMEIPKKREIRTKNLFNVADCKLHWQKSGDFLGVKVDRFSKSKKSLQKDQDVKFLGMFYNFEIFHMREKDIPVENVEIKEPIGAFAWEPVGDKFAIIHGEGAGGSNVSFYEAKKGQKLSLVKKMERKSASHLFWSPRGGFVVLANTTQGVFEFVDTQDFTIMNTVDHHGASQCEWDPTGRYVVTGVSAYKAKDDHSYYMWSFQGRLIKRVALKSFLQLLWRPRPETLLSDAQEKEIRKNLKKFYPQFEAKDRLRQTRASKELLEKRAKLREEFVEYRQKRISDYDKLRSMRIELRNRKFFFKILKSYFY